MLLGRASQDIADLVERGTPAASLRLVCSFARASESCRRVLQACIGLHSQCGRKRDPPSLGVSFRANSARSAKRSERREGVAVRRPLQSSGRMTPTGTMSTRLAMMSRSVSFPFATPTTRDGRRLYSTEHAKRVVDEAILDDFMASLPRHEQPERCSGKIAKGADPSAH